MRPSSLLPLLAGLLLGIAGTWLGFVATRSAPSIEARSNKLVPRTGDDAKPLRTPSSPRFSSKEKQSARSTPGTNPAFEPAAETSAPDSPENDQNPQLVSVASRSADNLNRPPFHGVAPSSQPLLIEPNDDHTYTSYQREGQSLTKANYSESNTLKYQIRYSIDDSGRLSRYEVRNSENILQYIAKLGYSTLEGPSKNKLVQELLYLPRRPQAAHMFVYSYTADGAANPPVGVSLIKDPAFKDAIPPTTTAQGKLPTHIVEALNRAYPEEVPLIP